MISLMSTLSEPSNRADAVRCSSLVPQIGHGAKLHSKLHPPEMRQSAPNNAQCRATLNRSQDVAR